LNMTPSPWTIAIVTWPIWVAIVIGGELLQVGGGTSLDALISSQLVLALVAAPLFLLAVVARQRWWREVGFRCTPRLSELRLLWLPALFIAGIFLLAIVAGLPSRQALVFITANTLLVGFSEELMFRGILLNGARSRFNMVTAVLITSVMFGLVHAMNGLLTGDYLAAFSQALQATLFGVWIAALRLRLSSIWPVMLIHALWDLGISLMVSGTAAGPAAIDGAAHPMTLSTFFLPALIQLPLFLYGVFLLRGLRHQPADPAV